MPADLGKFKTEDLEHFKLDPDGNLYWKGKRVRCGGWSTADRIAIAGVVVAILLGVVTGYTELKALWSDLTRQSPAAEATTPAK